MSRKKATYQCEYCAASFNRPYRLEIHLRAHTGERPFVCEYEGCGKSYSNSSHLKRHETIHESTYKCPVEGCSEILKTKATLKKHIDNMHQKKQKMYECTECGKSFNKRNWLQSHMFRHTGKYPYKCQIEDCGKEFLVPSKLKRHMKVHDGYKCKIPGCEEVFLKWSLYVTHLKQFHPKVHKCHVCEKEFSTSTNLKTHSEVHGHSRKVFACDMPNCSRFYFAEKNLNWHIKHYHEARPHVCDMEFCHRAFKTQDALDYHKQHHVKKRKQKKKKTRPGFAAVLSGCADSRKFIRKMPPKRVVSESSDEFTTDEEEAHDQVESVIDESSLKNSDCDGTGSEEGNEADTSQTSNRTRSRKRVRLPSSESADGEVKKMTETKKDEETPQEDICPRTFGGGLEGDKELTQTNDPECSFSNWEHLSKLAVLKTDENNFSTREKTNPFLQVISSAEYAAVTGNHTASDSECVLKQKRCLDDSASSSEYETITVSVLSSVGDKNHSESDEMSSCLSDAGG